MQGHTRREAGSQSQGTRALSSQPSYRGRHLLTGGAGTGFANRERLTESEKGTEMLARMRKAAEEREGGFTLIELLVVIIIIGILAAIAIPVFLNQRQKGYDAQAKSDLRNAATAEETYMVDNQAYTEDVAPASAGGTHDILYKDSPNAGTVVAHFVNADGTALGTDATVGFCLETTSDSGTVWSYNSGTGGVQGKDVGCPTA